MSDNSVSTGSCLCGKIKVKVTGKPVTTFNCYCTICRKSSGNLGKLGSLLRPKQLEIENAAHLDKFTEEETDSKLPKHAYRCKTCGTAIYSVPELAKGKVIAFSPALLDNGFENFKVKENHYVKSVPEAWKSML